MCSDLAKVITNLKAAMEGLSINMREATSDIINSRKKTLPSVGRCINERTCIAQSLTCQQLDLDRHKRSSEDTPVEPTFFDGRNDPEYFVKWLVDVDCYLNWYAIPDARQLEFAVRKLTKQAKTHWIHIQCVRNRSGQGLIKTWKDMIDALRIPYLPPFYYDKMLSKWLSCIQGKRPVKEYIDEFHDFVIRGRLLKPESPMHLLSWFRSGL